MNTTSTYIVAPEWCMHYSKGSILCICQKNQFRHFYFWWEFSSLQIYFQEHWYDIDSGSCTLTLRKWFVGLFTFWDILASKLWGIKPADSICLWLEVTPWVLAKPPFYNRIIKLHQKDMQCEWRSFSVKNVKSSTRTWLTWTTFCLDRSISFAEGNTKQSLQWI